MTEFLYIIAIIVVFFLFIPIFIRLAIILIAILLIMACIKINTTFSFFIGGIISLVLFGSLSNKSPEK